MFHNIFSYEPSRQYGISPFSKTIIKDRFICKRGIGEIRIFLIDLPIELPIGPVLFRCGITAPCYSGVE